MGCKRTNTMNNETNQSKPDTIYSSPKESLARFSFNKEVVDVFPDMINRSVPGYATIIDGIGKIAKQHCTDKPVVYDLGCSLGSVSLSIAKQTFEKSPHIIGIDNSEAMIEKCSQHINAFNYGHCIELQQGDLINANMKTCDLVVINFTLQFVEPSQRQSIINKVYKHLKPGGMLILSEKVKHSNSDVDNFLIELHHNFKRENGYSDLEISQKRSALEDVMKLDTIETHKSRLSEAGFSALTVWYQQFNFLSLIAIK